MSTITITEKIILNEVAEVLDDLTDVSAAAPLNGQSLVWNGTAWVPQTVAFNDGTAAAPSITNNGDLDTGAYFPDANVFAVTTGGTERIRFTNTGIGVNVATPTEALQIAATIDINGDNGVAFADLADSTKNIAISRTHSGYSYNGISGAVGRLYSSTSLALVADTIGGDNSILFSVGGSVKAELQWDGKFGIGTTSPATILDVNGDVTITDKIIHSGDTDTSIRFPAVDTVTLETGGVERLRVTSTGSIGIGTTSPATTLDVNGDVTITDKIIHSGDTDTAIRFPATDTISFETAGAEKARITSIGRVGVGVTSPDRVVHIAATSAAPDDNGIQYTVSGDITKNVIFGITGLSHNYSGVTGQYGRVYSSIGLAIVADIVGGNNPILFSTGQQERVRISGTGTVHFPSVGTTASSANAFLDSSATPSNQLLRSTSSIQYKTEVTDITLSEAQNVFSLRPIKYQSLATADDPNRVWYGLIAEEVSEVDQRLVHYRDGAPDGVQYERIIVPLLKIVKDLSQRVAALEAQNG